MYEEAQPKYQQHQQQQEQERRDPYVEYSSDAHEYRYEAPVTHQHRYEPPVTYGDQLGNAFGGVVVGVILFVASHVLLFYNEGNPLLTRSKK
jgi:hypothetical protein